MCIFSAAHLPYRQNVLRRSLSASAHFVHYRGAPVFLGTVTKDSTWHPHSSLPRSTDSSKFWCPFLWDRCQLRLGGGAQRPGSLGDRAGPRTRLHARARSKCARSWTGRRAHAVGGGGAAAPGDARVCAPRGRLAGGAHSRAASVAPGRARAAAPTVPSLRPAGVAGLGAARAREEQRPYRPLSHLHLLRLLLLPPATRSVTTGSDWPGCPAKESDRGEKQGK